MKNQFLYLSKCPLPLKSGSARSSTSSMGRTCFCSTKFLAAVSDVNISSSEISNSSFFNLSNRSCLLSLVVLVTNLTMTEALRNLGKSKSDVNRQLLHSSPRQPNLLALAKGQKTKSKSPSKCFYGQ